MKCWIVVIYCSFCLSFHQVLLQDKSTPKVNTQRFSYPKQSSLFLGFQFLWDSGPALASGVATAWSTRDRCHGVSPFATPSLLSLLFVFSLAADTTTSRTHWGTAWEGAFTQAAAKRNPPPRPFPAVPCCCHHQAAREPAIRLCQLCLSTSGRLSQAWSLVWLETCSSPGLVLLYAWESLLDLDRQS